MQPQVNGKRAGRGASRKGALLLSGAVCAIIASPGMTQAAGVEPYYAASADAVARNETRRLNSAPAEVAADSVRPGDETNSAPSAAPAATDAAPFVADQQVIQIPPAATAAAQTPARSRLNPTGRAMQIVAALNDRDTYLGDVEIRVLPDDSVEVSGEQVLAILGRLADASDLERLRGLAAPGAFLPIAQYADLGFPLSFDPSALALSVEIPPQSRVRQSIGVADLDRSVYGEFSSPARVSGYLNLRSNVDYVHKGQNTGFGDTFVQMDGATRFHNVVLESEGNWRSTDSRFSRDGTRLVYDDIEHLNRWVGGDLLPQARGFQGVQDMAGVSVERTYSLLDPQRNITPRGGRSFTLDREATVEAYVNGRVARTMRLQPGSYDVSDFPFVQGSNDVELVISDDTGRREVLSFSVFIDRTQLAPGLSEYGFYAGVSSARADDRIDYSSDPAASGFYRRGISENLTLGGNFQYANSGGVVGAEAVWGTALGTLGGDVAFSQLDDVGSGWATNLSFERLQQSPGGGSSISATLEARSRRFGAPSQLAPDNRYLLNAVLAYNRSFGDSTFIGGQLRYAMAREGVEDESTVRISYGRRLGDTFNIVIDADWTSGGFSDGAGVRVGLVKRFGSTGSARAEYDSQSERGRLGYQTSGGQGVGAWSAAGTLEGGADSYAFNGSAAYAANRADISVAHNTGYSVTSNDIVDQRTSLRGATSIAFADGAFAIGRPITDGFAIVRPYRGASNVRLEVEPSPEGYYARTGVLGPALYGQVGSYSPRSIIFDAPNAPPAFDIGSGSTRVLAPYRAGYLINVGSDYGVTAIGRLLSADGQPLTFLSGKATEQGGEGRVVDIFTNRQGVFGASGLKAGRWRIEMLGGTSYDLTIPETQDGIARVGDLSPTR